MVLLHGAHTHLLKSCPVPTQGLRKWPNVVADVIKLGVRLSGAGHSLPQGDWVLVRRGVTRADRGSRLMPGEGERDASVQQTSPHGTRS